MSSTALQYTQNGDYLIPNIELNQPQTPLGKYGRMRRMFLKERLEQMMLALTQAAGATEELKARDPMQWTGRMNACKAQAEEVIRNELIFN